MALDTGNTNIGYRLGRLFATLEKIQEEASPGINATIRDRFYGAASGTPVAAFPEDGPREVLGAGEGGAPLGGVLHDSLLAATQQALSIPRSEARTRALEFTWAHAARLFQQYLVPARSSSQGFSVSVTKSVTQLSSGR